MKQTKYKARADKTLLSLAPSPPHNVTAGRNSLSRVSRCFISRGLDFSLLNALQNIDHLTW